MKKLMVLAAGLLQIPVIKKAREMGYYVIAVDDDPNAPGMALADKAIVPGGLMNEEKLQADIYYVEHLSFLFDCKVIWLTIKTVLSHKDVYRA